MAECLLVHYGEDDSVSVLKSNSKQILEYSGNFVKVKWPRLGVFDGTILEKSNNKKELDEKAKSMSISKAQSSRTSTQDKTEELKKILKSKEKLDSGKESRLKTKSTATLEHKAKSTKVARVAATNLAAQQLFHNTEIQLLKKEIAALQSKLTKQSSCSTAIFDGDDDDDVDVDDDVNTGDVSSAGDDACPDYENLNYNSRKRNQELLTKLGLKKYEPPLNKYKQTSRSVRNISPICSNATDPVDEVLPEDISPLPPSIHLSVGRSTIDKTMNKKKSIPESENEANCREKIPVPKIELVKHMGVLIKATDLSSCLRKSKRQPTRLLQLLDCLVCSLWMNYGYPQSGVKA